MEEDIKKAFDDVRTALDKADGSIPETAEKAIQLAAALADFAAQLNNYYHKHPDKAKEISEAYIIDYGNPDNEQEIVLPSSTTTIQKERAQAIIKAIDCKK
jgi:ABC-type transporter Mla subunit MlaD